VQAQLISDLRCVHGVGQVLLVGEDQQHRVAQLVLRRTEGRPSGQTARSEVS
jgi:hypothetical protein